MFLTLVVALAALGASRPNQAMEVRDEVKILVFDLFLSLCWCHHNLHSHQYRHIDFFVELMISKRVL
jgi:hypothetical protein